MASPTVNTNYLVETNARQGDRLVDAGRLLKSTRTLVGKRSSQTKDQADVLGRAKDPSLAEQAKLQLEDPLSHPRLAPLSSATSSTGEPTAPASSNGDSPLLPSPGLAYFVALIMNEANNIYSQLELSDNKVEQNQLEYYDAQADEYAQQEKNFYHAQMTQAIATTIGMAAMGAFSLFALGKSSFESKGLKGLLSFGYCGDGGDLGEIENLSQTRDFLQGLGGKSATIFNSDADAPAELEVTASRSQTEVDSLSELKGSLEAAEDDVTSKSEKLKEWEDDYNEFRKHLDDPVSNSIDPNNQFYADLDELDDDDEGAEEGCRESAKDKFESNQKRLERDYDAAKEKFKELDSARQEKLDNVKEQIKKVQTRQQERAAVATQIGTIGQSLGQTTQQAATAYASTKSGLAAANKAIADRKRTDGQMGLQAAQGLFSGASQSLDSFFSTTNTVLNAVFQAQRA